MKWDFIYVYQWSPQRYCKTIEAETLYDAIQEFYKLFPNDEVILVDKRLAR